MAIIKKFRIKNFKQKKELLKLEKISLYFGKRKILEDLNLNLNHGEILGLLGPNGVGKSTIFNIIIGLLKPDYGSVLIEKKNVTNEPIFYRTKKYKISYVPQARVVTKHKSRIFIRWSKKTFGNFFKFIK